jgi:hypothetical protein
MSHRRFALNGETLLLDDALRADIIKSMGACMAGYRCHFQNGKSCLFINHFLIIR